MVVQPSQFEIQPSSGVPIYRQIIDQVQALVMGRQLVPGEMLPSVRDMATVLGVNPMTISKAYARLEADGTLERIRGKGMQVRAQIPTGSLKQRCRELDAAMQSAVLRGRQLGLNDAEILKVLHKVLKESPQ